MNPQSLLQIYTKKSYHLVGSSKNHPVESVSMISRFQYSAEEKNLYLTSPKIREFLNWQNLQRLPRLQKIS